MHTEFHKPALLDDRLKVVTYFSHIGRTSLKINFDVMNAADGTLLASAYQVLVCVGRKDLQKRELPREIIAALEPYTMECDEARRAA